MDSELVEICYKDSSRGRELVEVAKYYRERRRSPKLVEDCGMLSRESSEEFVEKCYRRSRQNSSEWEVVRENELG